MGLAALSLALASVVGAAPQEIDRERAVGVKAAYLYNFTKFVSWPKRAFADDRSPLQIGIAGADPFGAALDAAVKDKTADGRAIQVKRFDALGDAELPREALRACHILFIPESEKARCDEIVEAVRGACVLCVSDLTDFAVEGGAIELALEGGTIVFKVNREAASDAGVKLSAKLLSLARIVEPRDKPKDRPPPP